MVARIRLVCRVRERTTIAKYRSVPSFNIGVGFDLAGLENRP